MDNGDCQSCEFLSALFPQVVKKQEGTGSIGAVQLRAWLLKGAQRVTSALSSCLYALHMFSCKKHHECSYHFGALRALRFLHV